MPSNQKVLIVMGVSGTGKTTIGKMLAHKLDIPFFDGDDFHPESNVEKMSTGIPLEDSDRLEWLQTLNKLAKKYKSSGAVIACSALKEYYREILKEEMEDDLEFIFLEGSFQLIKNRMEQRKGHFMPMALLQSQFDILEAPKKAITVSVDQTPEELVAQVLIKLQ